MVERYTENVLVEGSNPFPVVPSRGVAQLGGAVVGHTTGRWFKSSHPDLEGFPSKFNLLAFWH